MNFNILFVEDTEEHVTDLENAVAHSRKTHSTSRPLYLDSVSSPDDITQALEAKPYDLVLADVFFGVPPRDRLQDIIDAVSAWSQLHRPDRSIPIVAYTSGGTAALQECLKHRDSLYDIWDKHTARPPYVAWRFNQLALEFARNRPDALLQRRIRLMPTSTGSGFRLNASWHKHVVDMTLNYDRGVTERDQVTEAGASIYNIASDLGTFPTCSKCWAVMIEWEALGRAVSRKTRGHARHVINVFWMGYCILHHPNLRDWFSAAWSGLIAKRANMDAVREES